MTSTPPDWSTYGSGTPHQAQGALGHWEGAQPLKFQPSIFFGLKYVSYPKTFCYVLKWSLKTHTHKKNIEWHFFCQGKSGKLQCIQWRLTYCTKCKSQDPPMFQRLAGSFNRAKQIHYAFFIHNIFRWSSSGYNGSINKHSKTAIAPGLLRVKRGIIESVPWREEGSTGKYQPHLEEFAKGAIKRIFREWRLLFPSVVYRNPLVLSFDT